MSKYEQVLATCNSCSQVTFAACQRLGGGAVFCGWRYMWVAAFGHKLSPVEAKSNREPPGLVVCGKWRLLGESFGWIRAKYLLV